MSFPALNTSYGQRARAADGHNPYARAAAAWDERIGSARVQAQNWRYIAFGSMLLALISTTGAVVLGVKKQVATYVVEIDKAGMPGRITLASDLYHPDAVQVGYFVGEVVRLVRERPLDPVVMRQQWTKAYQFLAGQAVNSMNEFAATDSGLKNLPGQGAVARTVEISRCFTANCAAVCAGSICQVEVAAAAGKEAASESTATTKAVKNVRRNIGPI